LGHEAGVVLGGLHHGGISWGTYEDLLGRHCNAHANNFVVVDPRSSGSSGSSSSSSSSSSSGQYFLAPLDFDMAFTRDTFISSSSSSSSSGGGGGGSGGSTTSMTFDEIVVMEHQCCITSLAGDDYVSTGVGSSSSSSGGGGTSLTGPWALLRWGMRDTLVRGFLDGYRSSSSSSSSSSRLPPGMIAAYHDVIKLALTITSQLVV